MNNSDCFINIILKLIDLEYNDIKHNTDTEIYKNTVNVSDIQWCFKKLIILYQRLPLFKYILSSKQIIQQFNNIGNFYYPIISFPEFIIKYMLMNLEPLFCRRALINYGIYNNNLKLLSYNHLYYDGLIKILNSDNSGLIEYCSGKKNIIIKRDIDINVAYINSLRSISKEEVRQELLSGWIYNRNFDIVKALRIVNQIRNQYNYPTSQSYDMKSLWNILSKLIRIYDRADILKKIIKAGVHSVNKFQHSHVFTKSGYSTLLLGYKLGKLSINNVCGCIISKYIHTQHNADQELTLLQLLIKLDGKFSKEQYYRLAEKVYTNSSMGTNIEAMIYLSNKLDIDDKNRLLNVLSTYTSLPRVSSRKCILLDEFIPR